MKFSCVGLLSMLLDQGLFALFVNLIFMFLNPEKAIIFSTIAARVCSSLFNYMMNKNIVFGASKGKSTLVRYYLLCAVQMMVSALGVLGAYMFTKVNASLLKLIVDLMLFFISYRIQQKWVFAKEKI